MGNRAQSFFTSSMSESNKQDFLWRISLLNHIQTKTLILGYIRSSVSCIDFHDHRIFDDDIINQCVVALECNLLNRMKNASVGQGFMSDTFFQCNFYHILEIFPCGIDE